MTVSGGYNTEVARTATGLRIGSEGEITMHPGAELYGLTGDIVFNLAGGLVASASGAAAIIASGLNPRYARANGTTDPTGRIRWTSAAGTTTPVLLPTVPVPDDFDKTSPAILRLYGEGTSGQAVSAFTAAVFVGVGAADGGATTPTFTSSPSEKTISIASGALASAGPITVTLAPQAHASGSIDLYGAKLTYKRRQRST